MIDDTRLRLLSKKQHGLVSIEQVVACGFGPNTRVDLAHGKRWERPTPRVLRLVGSADTQAQRLMLAVLDAGAGGALSSTTAAAWWGIQGNLLEPIHVLRLRHRADRPGRAGRVHEPTLLLDEHVVVLDGVPTVVPTRALFEVAGTRRRGAEIASWVEKMERMVDSAWADRLVSGRSMHGMLGDLAQRGRPGIRVMRQVLANRPVSYVPPASGLESRFMQILRNAGIPPLRRQIDSGDGDRWIGRVDFRDADLPLIVEVQSERHHTSLIDTQLDATRIDRLEAEGFVVVTVTEEHIWHRPSEVIKAVQKARTGARSVAEMPHFKRRLSGGADFCAGSGSVTGRLGGAGTFLLSG